MADDLHVVCTWEVPADDDCHDNDSDDDYDNYDDDDGGGRGGSGMLYILQLHSSPDIALQTMMTMVAFATRSESYKAMDKYNDTQCSKIQFIWSGHRLVPGHYDTGTMKVITIN